MDLRMHYLLPLKSVSARTRDSIPSHRAIGREFSEWILFREYWDGKTGLDSLSIRMGVPREEVSCFLWECFGERFLTIRKRLRIEDAKELLLKRPDLTQSQISRTIGFSDKSDFRRAFKDETGYSPNLWRESGGSRWRCCIRKIRESDRSRCHGLRRSS